MAHFENHWFKYRTCRMQLAASKFNAGSGTLLARPVLPRWHDVSKTTLQTCTLLNNINSSIARSKMSDVAIMAMDE